MDSVSFEISNPSSWTRTDYVQVDLERLNLPAELDEGNLELYRTDGDRWELVPFQIDYPMGSREDGIRVLVFLAKDIPAGSEHYTDACARYLLRSAPGRNRPSRDNPWIGYYYAQPRNGEPPDGFNKSYEPNRPINGVKLFNGSIELYLSLIAEVSSHRNAKGAITSVLSPEAYKHTLESGEILSQFWQDRSVFWGQITQLSFFPLPWERKWFYKYSLRDDPYEYELVYSKSGPIRATISLRVGPITIPYEGTPVLNGRVNLQCDFYRMIYVYPNDDSKPEAKPYYLEEMFVLGRQPRCSIPFRPYYASVIAPDAVETDLRRFEFIPDYFVIWKHFGPTMYRGYGFASDSHVRGLELQHGSELPDYAGQYNQKVFWRLPLSHHNRCVHYFWFLPSLPDRWDPFQTIGHDAWYEKIFKPLAPLDPQLRFPSPIPGCEEDRADVR